MVKRQGFTLVELVVVVMILGILAAVAAPKLLGTSGTATDNGLRQTVSVVRDAIERYAAEHGGKFPGTTDATFKSELIPYLRGAFPTCPVGTNKNNLVDVVATGSPLGVNAGASTGWRYCYGTGEFIVNSADSDNSAAAAAYNTY